MNKKTAILFVLLLNCTLIFGCVDKQNATNETVSTQTETSEETDSEEGSKQEEEQTETSQDNADINKPDAGHTSVARNVKIYCVNEDGTGIKTIEKEIEDEQDIWKELITVGILDDTCELLDFEVNEEEKRIVLNTSRSVGNRIRSMGTTGEQEIVGCIVNTYLDAYQCEKILLKEEGNDLQTSHGANVQGDLGKFVFE